MSTVRWLALAVFTGLAAPASAAFHLFRIQEIYSNADGQRASVDRNGVVAAATPTNLAGVTGAFAPPTPPTLPPTPTASSAAAIPTFGAPGLLLTVALLVAAALLALRPVRRRTK